MTDSPTEETPYWRRFWNASSLSAATAPEFQTRIRDFRPQVPAPEPLVQAGPELPLPTVKDSLQKLMRKRRSDRGFGEERLSLRDVGRLLSAFRENKGRRTYPSAGALYPIHAMALCLHTADELDGYVLRYEPRTHAVGKVCRLPSAAEVERFCNLDAGIHPQMIIVFVAYVDEAERKYGERAARFALIEAGHMAQNLALRITKSRLKGYELGGIQDHELMRVMGVARAPVLITHAYACGK